MLEQTQPSPLGCNKFFHPLPGPTTFSQNLKQKHWSRSILMLQCKILKKRKKEKRNIDLERISTLPLDYKKFFHPFLELVVFSQNWKNNIGQVYCSVSILNKGKKNWWQEELSPPLGCKKKKKLPLTKPLSTPCWNIYTKLEQLSTSTEVAHRRPWPANIC